MAERNGAPCAAWFADAAGARLVNGADAVFDRVETDSRSAGPGALFIALKGERSDGHDFVRMAADAGASAVLVSARWYAAAGTSLPDGLRAAVIVADDTLGALQKAATAWRKRFPSLLRFGVTGSAGKTSTKELLASILEHNRPTVKNPGNLNSDIGLAASLFLVRQEHSAAVFEMGINYPGEMETLAAMYEPDCALVTNIGTAHIGVLGGTRDDIAREKKKIASRFDGTQRMVVPEDDDFRDRLLENLPGRGFTFGPRSDDGFEGARDLGVDGWVIRYRGTECRLHLPGAHNLRNALGAIRAATLYGAEAGDVAAGLDNVRPLDGRTSIIRGDWTIVDDCYNANAESMLAAIEFCDSLPVSGRRIYVMGAMRELGAESDAAHRRIGQAAAVSAAGRSASSVLVFYGEETRPAFETARSAACASSLLYFENYGDLEKAVVPLASAGDLILVKASRTLALERLTGKLALAMGVTLSSSHAGAGGHHVP